MTAADASAPAWLFDVYPHPKRSVLVVWTLHAGRMERRHVPYQPDFCVKAETCTLEEAERLLAEDPRVEATWRDTAALWLRSEPQPVLRVRPKRLQDVHAVASDLRRRTKTTGFRFFDVDHAPEARWMHREGLFSMCRLHVGPDGPELRLAEGEGRWTLDYPDPDVRSVALEVETATQGPARAWDDPLVAIRLDGHEVRVRGGGPGDAAGAAGGNTDAERTALMEFGRLLRRLDPHVVFTRHGDRFDVPYLLRRIRRHRLEDHVRLGRDADPHPDRPDQAAKSIHTYGRWLYKDHCYYLRGRWHIDLAKKPLDTEDPREDLHGILYLARTANRRAQDINRNGAGFAIQQMQIDEATDRGVALPWKRNLTEGEIDAATLCAVDRGGQIMVPVPGVYGDVAALDFSGFYPNIVAAHNLSSDTINCTCCPDGPLVPELGYHVCKKEKGHQALILKRLMPHRAEVKAVVRQAKRGTPVPPARLARAKAIKGEMKAIGVVCFGYFRYRNARFGAAEVHQAIQCFGRQAMTDAHPVAEERGFRVLHTITDCAFLQKPGVTRGQALRVARAISKAAGVVMDLEGIYRWVVFLPSKTHSTEAEVGVPNRYYGLFEDGTLKVRGIEVQRHSTPDWLFETQQAMLDVLAQAPDANAFLAAVPRAVRVAKAAADDLRARRVPAAKLATVVQARMAVEDYRASTGTKAALRRLRERGIERRPGEYVKFVVTRQEGAWDGRVAPVELLDDAGWFEAPPPAYRGDVYLRLLARSVETLFAPFGYAEDALLAWFQGRTRGPKPAAHQRVPAALRPAWVRA